MTSGLHRYACLILLLCCTACSLFPKKADHFGAREITFAALPGWGNDDYAEALSAFMASCPILAKKARPASSGSGLEISEAVWKSLCDDAGRAQHNPQAAQAFFERRFTPFRINNNGNEKGLFTGYYEPVLYGSYHKGGDFIYPLYAAPPELKNSKPYYAREDIDDGQLEKRRLEIIWVDDPVMSFFLHIQGSGRVKLSNGKELRIGYAEQNGQPYVGLGKIMADEGLIPKDQINFFTLRQWLYTHKQQAFAMMARNPSYVFFKIVDGPGPLGAVGAVLTPQRSLAVDSSYIPYGLPLFIETELPAEPARQPIPFNRIIIAQDTGGAIRGPVRGDIFFGAGDAAEYYAGYMKGRGSYNLLVPNEVASQLR